MIGRVLGFSGADYCDLGEEGGRNGSHILEGLVAVRCGSGKAMIVDRGGERVEEGRGSAKAARLW